MCLERYKSSPNQERIVFDNYSRAEKSNNSKNGVPFIYATREDEYKAMRLLRGKGNAFLLWRYFLDNISWNDEKNVFWLSPQAIESDIGLTGNMYDTAKKALISHGFLTWEGGKWYFHPAPKTPQPKPKEPAKQSESKQIEQPEPVANEPERTESALRVLTNIEDKLAVIRDACTEVSIDHYGRAYSISSVIPQKEVEEAIKRRGIYIDAWMQKRLDENSNLSLDEQGTDDLPF